MAQIKYLGTEGAEAIVNNVKSLIPQLIEGDNITLTPDATDANKITISSTASGGGSGAIDTVKVNGTALEITDKAVDVTVPTGAAADKGVDDSIEANDTSTDLPTTAAVVEYVKDNAGDADSASTVRGDVLYYRFADPIHYIMSYWVAKTDLVKQRSDSTYQCPIYEGDDIGPDSDGNAMSNIYVASSTYYSDSDTYNLVFGVVDGTTDGFSLAWSGVTATTDSEKYDYPTLSINNAIKKALVKPDWNTTDSNSDSYIKNKPTLGTAATKSVDTSISAASTSTNLPTSAAVASFVEGKGYKTTDTTYTLTQDETDGHILTFTPSSGEATTITIPDNVGSGEGGSGTVDTKLSTTSTNAVQNKVVTAAINGKETSVWKGTKAEFTDEVKASLTSGTLVVLTDDLNGNTGNIDYDDVTDKPSINSVSLIGNKTSDDLSLASSAEIDGVRGTTSAYDASTEYAVGDYAIHSDCLWKCVQVGTGNEPSLDSSYWKRVSLADIQTKMDYMPTFDWRTLTREVLDEDLENTNGSVAYTIPKDGWYQIAHSSENSNANNMYTTIGAIQNETYLTLFADYRIMNTATANYMYSLTPPFYFKAGETLFYRTYTNQTSGTPLKRLFCWS